MNTEQTSKNILLINYTGRPASSSKLMVFFLWVIPKKNKKGESDWGSDGGKNLSKSQKSH